MKTVLSSVLLALMLTAAPAYADIGEQKAVAIAQSVHPGRVLAVKRVQAPNGAVYRVKTLSAAGDVRIIVVDAESGQVISQ